jgi:hypothetical protein
MCHRLPLLALAFAAGLALTAAEGAQSPEEAMAASVQPPPKKGPPPDGKGGKGPKGPKGKKGPPESSLTMDDIVARVLAFDTDKTGAVKKEQLPERMQHLVDLGDTNKDGLLDETEIKALSAKLASEMPSAFKGKGKGKGPKGPGGKGFGPPKKDGGS